MKRPHPKDANHSRRGWIVANPRYHRKRRKPEPKDRSMGRN